MARPANTLTRRRLPKTRGDCSSVPRPCRFRWCRYHLWPEVRGKRLHIASCVLDLAEQEGLSQADVASLLGVSKQRIDQIEQRALVKLLDYASFLRILQDLRDALER